MQLPITRQDGTRVWLTEHARQRFEERSGHCRAGVACEKNGLCLSCSVVAAKLIREATLLPREIALLATRGSHQKRECAWAETSFALVDQDYGIWILGNLNVVTYYLARPPVKIMLTRLGYLGTKKVGEPS